MSFEITCKIKRETNEAILVFDFDNEEEIWLPLSQVMEIHRLKDDLATVVMTEWIAQKKGLL